MPSVLEKLCTATHQVGEVEAFIMVLHGEGLKRDFYNQVVRVVCHQLQYPFMVVELNNEKLVAVWESHAYQFNDRHELKSSGLLNGHELSLLQHEVGST